jgi:hypothetical protein
MSHEFSQLKDAKQMQMNADVRPPRAIHLGWRKGQEREQGHPRKTPIASSRLADALSPSYHFSFSLSTICPVGDSRLLTMEDRAIRSGAPHALRFRELAPLAALFEDCSEAIKRVHDVIINAEPDAEEKTSLRILIERCLGRLTTWGQEAGASSRLLDYTLRRASSPRAVTETLLKDLSQRLDNSMSKYLSLGFPETSN